MAAGERTTGGAPPEAAAPPPRPGPARSNGFIDFASAARHATRAVPLVDADQPVAAVLAALPSKRWDCASHVVVCRGERFAGIVTIESLLSAAPDHRMREIMDADPPLVAPGTHQQVAAWQATRRGEAALAVVDEHRRFVGLIPPDRLLAVLEAEHEEDLSRLGGFTHGLTRARRTGREPVLRRFRHRLPWVLVGLAGALQSVEIVGWFERQLQANLALAFFIPAVVYLADAVGTQTETVVVRALSVGLKLREMAGREVLTGLAIGALVAALAGPYVWFAWQDARLAVCIGLSLLLACTTATFTGVVLPWSLDQLALDPAFGSGPLATVIQDLLSILIYLTVASLVFAAV